MSRHRGRSEEGAGKGSPDNRDLRVLPGVWTFGSLKVPDFMKLQVHLERSMWLPPTQFIFLIPGQFYIVIPLFLGL